LSYRGEETPADHPIRTTFGSAGLTLKPLPEKAVHSIIRQLSGDDHPHISQQISAYSQGNPLFVVTLLQHMFESGQLYVHADGGWMMSEQDTPAMPPILQEAIKIRLDRLDRGVRRIFDYAAVMGGEFDFELMQAISQQPEEILLTKLDHLMDSALLVEPHNHNQAEFRISHDRYTEVTYEQILPARRRQMHLQVAQAIESVYAGRLTQVYAVLADHYHRAEKPEPTVRFATLAGEQAAARFASQEALYYYEMALANLPVDEISQRAYLLLACEQVFDLGGMRDRQIESLDTLDTLSPYLPLEQQAEIHLRRAGFAWIMGDNTAAEHAASQAIKSAQTSHAQSVHARALFLAGKIASASLSALPYLDQARKISIEIQQRALEGEIVRWLGNVNFWSNNYSQTQAYFEEALAIHKEVGDIRGELSVLNNLGHLYENYGQLQKAVEYYSQAGEICQKIGDRLAEGVILTNLGGLKSQLGHFLQAQEDLEKALVIRQEIGNDEGVAVIQADLADIFRQQGRLQKALDHYQTAIEINTHIGHDLQKGGALTGLSAVYRELGAYQQAQECLSEAFQHLTDAESPRYIQAVAQQGLLTYLVGEHQQALALGEQARSKSGSLLPLQALALKNIGHARAGLQQWEHARQNYQQAVGLYRQLGQTHLATEPLAGLAYCALCTKDLELALDAAREILEYINAQPLQGPDRVVWIYLTCYQVLDQIHDPQAVDVLQSAYRLIHQRADSLTEGVLRSAYLEEVPENRQVVYLWGQFSASH
jgi:tetratricopeptide (TPR) repeat protein